VITSPGFIIPAAIGSICLLTVCGVYLWKQSFRLPGLVLAVCGVVLLGASIWQPRTDDQTLPDLARLFGEIRDASTGRHAQLAEIIKNQAELAALLRGFEETRVPTSPAPEPELQTAASEAASLRASEETGTSTSPAPEPEPQAAASDAATPRPDSLEVEAAGGVSKEALDAVLSWVRDTKPEHPASVILIEPVVPDEGADLDGQRRRLMNDAGRVIDHVFKETRQKVQVARLVSDDVPEPLLRLRLETSSAWQWARFAHTSETRASSLATPSLRAAEAGRETAPASSEPTADRTATRPESGALASRQADQNEHELDPQGHVKWGEEGSVIITFPVNSSYFPPGARQTLDSFLGPMKTGAPHRIQLQAGLSGSDKVAGTTGPDEAMHYNQWLAERRIDRVQKWLIEHAQERRLEIESKLVEDDSPRRVVVRAIPTG
jgi:outer membrane protein OmpA-like peptidoglycan-associated protein